MPDFLTVFCVARLHQLLPDGNGHNLKISAEAVPSILVPSCLWRTICVKNNRAHAPIQGFFLPDINVGPLWKIYFKGGGTEDAMPGDHNNVEILSSPAIFPTIHVILNLKNDSDE